jgi:pSer/pThr/pTyr-binding forkhead associated (FHA) protein
MARLVYRWKDHLDETGCADAGPVFVSVSVSSRHCETRREAAEENVSANVDVNGTSDGCVRVHGRRTRLRHPSQRDALQSSERHDRAGDRARAERPHHDHGNVLMNGCACDHEHRGEHGGHVRGHDHAHVRGHDHVHVRGYENDHDARDHPLPACRTD